MTDEADQRSILDAVPRQGEPADARVLAWMQRALTRRTVDLAAQHHLLALADWLEDITGLLREHRGGTWHTGSLREVAREQYLQRLVAEGQVDDAYPPLLKAVAAVQELIDAIEAEHAFRAVVDASGDLVLVLDDAGHPTFVSASVQRVLGWTPEDLLGQSLAGLVHAADLERFMTLVDPSGPATAADAERPRTRLRGSLDRGLDEWRTLEWTVSRHSGHELGGVVLTGRDVTDRVEVERELVHQASHDTLTGLPNRKAIMTLTRAAVAEAPPQQGVGFVMVDLDRFKDVNDSLGHAVGDQLLALVGPRLRGCLRPSDVIARLGGDEFAVLLPVTTPDGARVVAERLSAALDAPFLVDGMELHVDASFGIAVTKRLGRTEAEVTEALMRKADIAMYRAKEGGTGIALFDPERDNAQNRSRLELSADLRRAVVEGQLVVHYQPVVDVLEGRLAGVEALVRWQHPERGLLAPGEFLPLAETSGLVVPLSKVVLNTSLAQAAAWAASGRRVQVAVNLSPRWLQHGDVPEVVAQALADHGVDPELLRLEITESVVLADPQTSLTALERLREMGIGLSLDDFGTGYSSMTHLRSLPVDQLKVDRAFVAAMTTCHEDAVIVRTAVELGHALGMEVVAEGIEDADTLSEIVASGCSLAQGYYFSRPMAADALRVWADERFPAWARPTPDAS